MNEGKKAAINRLNEKLDSDKRRCSANNKIVRSHGFAIGNNNTVNIFSSSPQERSLTDRQRQNLKNLVFGIARCTQDSHTDSYRRAWMLLFDKCGVDRFEDVPLDMYFEAREFLREKYDLAKQGAL